MKIIDANTGHEIEIGVPFRNVHGTVTIEHVKEGLLSAKAFIKIETDAGATHLMRSPLIVRYLHPAFFLKKVAFLPS